MVISIKINELIKLTNKLFFIYRN